MIVKNEEVMLPGCLESVCGLADEIVVVDTGSTDRTVEIVTSYQAKVVHFPWKDDFSSARNESLRHATGDWVLVLDADERLQPECGGELKNLIEREDLVGVNVWLASQMPDGPAAEVLAARYCRLFRRLPGIEFTGLIHEQVLPSLQRLKGRVVNSEIVIRHLGYAGASPTKLRRNLKLLEQAVVQTPDDPFVHFNLGLTLHGIGRWAESTQAFEAALAHGARTLERELQALAWAKIADNCLLLDCPEEAIASANASLTMEPSAVLPRYTLAMSLGRLGQHERALEETKSLIFRSSDGAFRVQLRIEVLLEAAGGFLMQLGRPNEAALYYEEAIRHADSPQLHYLLGSALVLAGAFEEAEAAYEEAARRGYPMASERQVLSRKLAQMREAVR
jgi:tetratricopeptide (TPR) repeat protein